MINNQDQFDITVNFQSILAKQADLLLFVNKHQPDIIFGTEIWLSPEVKSSEIFSPSYNIIRHERNDGCGGVLLGIQNNLNIL